MSKQFEEEYKALADREAPDLWARIEAGLTPRSTTPGDRDVKETTIRVFLKRYGGVAAAAVCVAILLPSALLVNRIGQKSYSDSAPAYEAALDEDVVLAENTEAEFEEAAPAGMAEMADEVWITDESRVTEESVCEAAADEDAADTVSGTASKEEMANVANGADGGAVKEERKSSMSAARGVDEAEILEDVTVKVLKDHGTGLTEAEKNPDRTGTVYTVEIVEDPSGSLEAGTRVDVLLSVFYSSYPTEGSSCQMTLQREEDSEAFAYLILGWQPAQ